MNQQPMNLRRAVKVTRRYKVLVGAIVLAGILLGLCYALISPPKQSAQAIVVLPQPTPNIATQVLIAGSSPVLNGALASAGSGETFEKLQKQITVSEATPNAISFTAKDTSGTGAENEANSVAAAYVSYITSSRSPITTVQAHVLVTATTSTGKSLADTMLIDGAIGLLAGLVIGLIAAAARDRRSMRLWQRDELARIASSPVLAGLAAPAFKEPGSGAAWARLFGEFEPLTGSTWQLRTVLERLAATGAKTVTVVSVADDRNALTLGPRLAAFAAGTGIRTALVVGPQAPPATAAGLLALESNTELENLRVFAADPAAESWSQPEAGLTVIVVAVPGASPAVPDAVGAAPAILAASAGALTGQELARVVTAVRRTGSKIVGIILGNPEATDQTTGRAPGYAKGAPARRPAAQTSGRVTEMH